MGDRIWSIAWSLEGGKTASFQLKNAALCKPAQMLRCASELVIRFIYLRRSLLCESGPARLKNTPTGLRLATKVRCVATRPAGLDRSMQKVKCDLQNLKPSLKSF